MWSMSMRSHSSELASLIRALPDCARWIRNTRESPTWIMRSKKRSRFGEENKSSRHPCSATLSLYLWICNSARKTGAYALRAYGRGSWKLTRERCRSEQSQAWSLVCYQLPQRRHKQSGSVGRLGSGGSDVEKLEVLRLEGSACPLRGRLRKAIQFHKDAVLQQVRAGTRRGPS